VIGQEQDPVPLVRAVELVHDRTDDVAVPSFERVDLHVDETLVPGFVGRFDVQHEQRAVGE
jgi:hypothetical protein